MVSVKVYLLGQPHIEIAGERVAVDTRKAIALLAYLAETERPVARDTLAALLWPEYPAARADANLRRTLWSLKQALTEEHLRVEQEWIALARNDELWVDSRHLRGLLDQVRQHQHHNAGQCAHCQALWVQALETMGGDFLEGFSLTDSAEFDDWQALQVMSFQQIRMELLRHLVQGLENAGDVDQALVWAQRWALLDPLDEPAHRHLMLLYARSDQAAAALHQYHELERRLRQQLDVAPDAETVKLYEAIKGKRIDSHFDAPLTDGKGVDALSAAPVIPNLGGGGVVPAFVAREAELERLRAMLVTVYEGHGQIALVPGEAGSGKTALLQRFAQVGQELYPNLVVVGGICNAYTGVGDPYLPFRQLLEMLAGDLDLAAQFRVPFAPATPEQLLRLWRLFPTVIEALTTVGSDLVNTFVGGRALATRAADYIEGETFAALNRLIIERAETPLDLTVNQSHLFEQVVRVLHQVALEAPLLLLLDDLQWADVGSVNLLFHLSRRLSAHRIFLVCAYRPSDVLLGRGQERHPLEAVNHEIVRNYGDIIIDIDQAQKRGLVDDLLDQEANHLDESFRETMLRQTGGHALFTVELLRGLKERGHLIRDDVGYWIAHATLDWGALPARVDAVLAEHITRLPVEWQELLRLASVEGEEFTAEVVARVLGKSGLEVVRTLSDQLDHKHNLVYALGVQRQGGQRLSRYRFRHNLIQRYLYQSLDTATRSYLSEEIALALEESYGAQSEEIATQLGRLFEDAGLLEKAIHYLRQAGDRALRLSANSEALDHYGRALDLLRQLPVTPERAGLQFALECLLTAPMQIIKGLSAPEVITAFDHALALGRQMGNPPGMISLLGRASHLNVSLGKHRLALSLAQECYELAARTESDGMLLEAYILLGVSHFFLGHFELALSNLSKALAIYDFDLHFFQTYQHGHDPGVHAGIYVAHTLWQLGYPDQAYAQLQDTIALAERTQHYHTIAFAQSFAALMYSFANDVPRTIEYSANTITISERHRFPQYFSLGVGLQGAALARMGHLEQGVAALVQARGLAKDVNILAMLPYMFGLTAECLQRIGQIGDALDLVETALQVAQQTEEAFHEATLHRLRGELFLDRGERWQVAKVEMEAALEAARRYQARSLGLQVAISYYRMAKQHGSASEQIEARQRLEQLHSAFTEGYSMPDLQEAAALLGSG